MRILVTGAKGQLGNEVLKVLNNEEIYGFGKEEMDITDFIQTQAKIKEIQPHVVIHCAAYTNVDGCESDVDLAFQVNSKGAENVARACLNAGAEMVYVSTDYVFDGSKGEPYYETDLPNPINVYGKSKLAGEESVKTVLSKYYIVRTAWVYGIQGKNFVKTMLELSKKQDTINVVNDQIGSPTYAFDLAQAIAVLINSKKYGIYHITNSGECSWYEFAKKIFELKGINIQVNPITSQQLNRPAKRPSYSVLKNFNLETNLGYKMRRWDRALEDFLNS